ncbi:hypothetical protein DAKH74_023040 [Maudiozyma humilis]|uniref:TLC domain-containing protein n=1 Tax=Maudiozyma humilis TaxID=51915 RepID=A0AAV5RWQ4_MAUHU|nr:hypothetical protein DAKH74_023040 [Kazachstania humilis]
MPLTAIQDYVITSWENLHPMWHTACRYVIYVVVNVLLYRSQKKNGGHPWLALAEMNVLVVCVLPAEPLSEFVLVPYLRSLEYSPYVWARWTAGHVVAFTVVFHSVWTVVMIVCTRCMFKRHIQGLDRASDRHSSSSDEETESEKKM